MRRAGLRGCPSVNRGGNTNRKKGKCEGSDSHGGIIDFSHSDAFDSQRMYGVALNRVCCAGLRRYRSQFTCISFIAF
jgi:hypothetical protein